MFNFCLFIFSYSDRSSVVIEALLAARKQKIDFRVIVVDSRPCLEGRVTAQLLSAANIPITYIFITAIGCIIQQVMVVAKSDVVDSYFSYLHR